MVKERDRASAVADHPYTTLPALFQVFNYTSRHHWLPSLSTPTLPCPPPLPRELRSTMDASPFPSTRTFASDAGSLPPQAPINPFGPIVLGLPLLSRSEPFMHLRRNLAPHWTMPKCNDIGDGTVHPTESSCTTTAQTPISVQGHLAGLVTHIAIQGFMQGAGSDITICAFDKEYRLHRLILMQAKFFEHLFQGPWREQHTSVIVMQFDDVNITREGFEMAIGRLYGIWTMEEDENRPIARQKRTKSCNYSLSQFSISGAHNIMSSLLTQKNVIAVLAAAAYLGMDVLCDQCTEYAVRTLSTNHLSAYVQFSHTNCYYPWSTQIANACHSFLCRNGFEDPRMECLQVFERLPVDWLIKVIGSDAFWVPSEWDRYKFCRRVVHRRRNISHAQLRQQDHNIDCNSDRPDQASSQAPCQSFASTSTFQSYQKDGHGSSSTSFGPHSGSGSGRSRTCSSSSTYTKDENAYQHLFSTCIVYLHMRFEQLQVILNDRDPLTGYRFTRSNLIHEALWQQIELRTIIEASALTDSALGIVVPQSQLSLDSPNSKQGSREYYPIPEQDRMHVGDVFSPISYQQSVDASLHATTLASGFNLTTAAQTPRFENLDEIHDCNSNPQMRPHSRFAPFRFSVTFQDLDQLEANVRISSKVFFYAG